MSTKALIRRHGALDGPQHTDNIDMRVHGCPRPSLLRHAGHVLTGKAEAKLLCNLLQIVISAGRCPIDASEAGSLF